MFGIKGTLDYNSSTVTKASAFEQAAPEGYVWSDPVNGVQSIELAVAQIGTTKYASLEKAFAAAVDGDTITVLADSSGNGIIAPQGKFGTNGLTVDFGGHTYDVTGTLVGSANTENNGFQLLKDNKITFKNGSITTTKPAPILIQNYSNLTLDGMTLSSTGMYYSQYTLSNNNGNIVIKDSTINAADYSAYNLSASDAGSFAFDVCRYSSYPSVNVTVTGNSEINGDVEVSASGSDAKDGFSLTLDSGTMNGEIVMDSSASAAMAAAPEKVDIKKKSTFNQAAPEGYVWSEAVNGVQTLIQAFTVTFDLNGGNIDGSTINPTVSVVKDTTIPDADKPANPTTMPIPTTPRSWMSIPTATTTRFRSICSATR